MISSVLAKTDGLTRQQWLETRRQGIGSSDAASVVGANPYRGRYSVYMDKIGELQEEPESEPMFWGKALESTVADEFARRLSLELATDVKVQRRNAVLQHREHDFMLANIDRSYRIPALKRRGVVECKTAGAWLGKEWENDSVPVMYYLQLQHQLAVTGDPEGYMAVLIGGQQYRHYPVPRNQEVIDWLIRQEGEFWRDHVLARVPPEPDGADSTRRILDMRFPSSEDGEWVQLDTEAADLAQSYMDALEDAKAAEARKDEAANRLKEKLGSAETGFAEGFRIEWKNRNRRGYEVAPKTYRHFQIYGER